VHLGAVDAAALLEHDREPFAPGLRLHIVLAQVEERLHEPALVVEPVVALQRLDTRHLGARWRWQSLRDGNRRRAQRRRECREESSRFRSTGHERQPRRIAFRIASAARTPAAPGRAAPSTTAVSTLQEAPFASGSAACRTAMSRQRSRTATLRMRAPQHDALPSLHLWQVEQWNVERPAWTLRLMMPRQPGRTQGSPSRP